MSKLRIGLDIDGVCYKWGKTVLYMMRDVLRDDRPDLWDLQPHTKDGPLGSEEKIDNWNYIEQHVHPEQWKWLWTRGIELGMFKYGHLYSGTIQAVRKLAKLGEVVVITHRPAAAVGDTLQWLGFMNLPLKGAHLLTNMEPKSGVKPECDVYIDDKPDNCFDLATNTKARLVALMDQPWNQTIPWETGSFDVVTRKPIIRVKNWDHFIRLVEML